LRSVGRLEQEGFEKMKGEIERGLEVEIVRRR